jgi:flagellar hook capping protein FlgD/pre-peptidase
MRRIVDPCRFMLRLLVAFAVVGGARAGAAQEVQRTPEVQAAIRAIKAIERQQLLEGTRHFAELREARARARRAGHGLKTRGARVRELSEPEMLARPDEDRARRRAAPSAAGAAATAPTNVRCNNPAGDAARAGQSEQWIVSSGSNVLVAWNDGQGFNTGGDTQGYGYSTDGGATFTDGGDVPKPAGFPSWKWTSDPVVGVNEKTGRFFYCGLAFSDGNSTITGHNSIGVAYGHFSGASFVWDNVTVARNVANSALFLDKEWLAADSSNNNVYVTNTTFSSSDSIELIRSTDGGATWNLPMVVSDPSEAGAVQGSRPAVGPNGEVYVVWQSLGSNDPDFYFIRKSTDAGVSFGARTLAVTYLANFGTGAPGFNRNRGITFPSITVDRTAGPNRGRVYLAWNESLDWFQFAGPVGSPISEPAETGLNNFAANAKSFSVGNVLRGSLANQNDLDWFKFSLAAGQSITVWADSLQGSMFYSCRILAPNPDSLQRLCFGGTTAVSSATTQSVYMFTAPATGTYYLRVAGPGSTVAGAVYGNYRVKTNFASNQGERGRDQRDAFITFSDNGTTWATPVRVNDDAVGFDEFLSEVAVGADGCPYVSWFDFRDDAPFGSRNHQYMSRSTNGGTSWAANTVFTTAQGNFTTCQSNIAPNMGDYSSLTCDARVLRPAWADGRGADVDVWSAAIDLSHQITTCPGPQTAIAHTPPMTLNLHYDLANMNPLYANTLQYALTSQRNWPLPSTSGTIAVTALGSSGLDLTVSVPDTAKDGINNLTLTVKGQRGLMPVTCVLPVTVDHLLAGVDGAGGPAFALGAVTPTPARGSARMAFSLPAAGTARLAIYGLRGELVRTLANGALAAGRHDVSWDGRDARGNAMPSGTYFVRLEGFGRSAVTRMVWMN